MSDLYQDIFNLIEQKYGKMSKSHKKIADFILKEYNRMPFLTASKIAKLVGVSESTVVRCAASLGYGGFPGLQRAFRERFQSTMTKTERVKLSDEGDDCLISRVMKADIDNIRETADALDVDELKRIVKVIKKSRKLFIFGSRSSTILAEYLTFYMNIIHGNVHLLSRGANDMYDEIVNIEDDDALIVFSFPRYSNRTFEVVEFAKSRKATIVGITDSLEAPLVQYCNHTLTAKYDMSTFIDSFVAPMSLVNAIILALAGGERDKMVEKFDLLESLWSLNDVYK